MRDLLSKLDAIVSETELKNPEDLQAKRKALADLEKDPVASDDPEISSAITQKKSDLEREAKSKGFAESFQIGDAFGISFSEDHEIATEIVDILEDGIVIELDDTALDMLTNEGLEFLEGELVEDKQKGVDGKACWKGYKRMGTKQKGGKTVDNCVPMGEDTEVQEQEMSRLRELAGMRQSMCNECGMSESSCGCEEPDNTQSGEYDFEGDMAKDDLFNIVQAARRLNGMLDDNENMPEWVQSKINKAEDYLDVAADYIEANKARDQVDMDEAKYQGREVQLNKPTAGDVGKFKVYVKDPSTGNVKKVNFGDKTMRIKKSNPARRKSFRARHRCENPGPKTKARYWSCRKW